MTKAMACADRVADVLEIGKEENGLAQGVANGQASEDENSQKEAPEGFETFVGASVSERSDADYLVFDHVALKYRGAGEETLEDVSFAVKKGDTVGVIGGTGSGKSSLVNLIPGFYPATEGKILFEGKDLASYEEDALRKRMGVVPQKAVLFQGTIRSNLLWGKPDATEEELWNALELAQAKEIVEGKDGKLDAEVAQNGRNFSGGQRQRLTIARALVRKPEILILDDSASALDYATDAKLRAAIKSIKDQTTTFIVSQRASSIRHADLIIVLDDGRVAGLGTHEELLQSCEVYQEIYYSQYPEERKEGAIHG